MVYYPSVLYAISVCVSKKKLTHMRFYVTVESRMIMAH